MKNATPSFRQRLRDKAAEEAKSSEAWEQEHPGCAMAAWRSGASFAYGDAGSIFDSEQNMKNATSSIRQMRADVDRLADCNQLQHEPEFVERVVVLRDGGMSMKIRLRKLHLGERLRNGDLWLDARDGLLRVLPRRWYRAFAGRVGPDSVDHYRIAP